MKESIGILGQRGLAKTTMMLQYIKENFSKSNGTLYVSLDNPYMQSLSLFEFAKEFEQLGEKFFLWMKCINMKIGQLI